MDDREHGSYGPLYSDEGANEFNPVDRKQPTALMNTYLVFESTAQHVTEQNHQTGRRMEYDIGAPLVSYQCVGSVRAVSEMDAVRAVMAITRRIGKYAVVPAVFIDFSPTMDTDNDQRPQLNP